MSDKTLVDTIKKLREWWLSASQEEKEDLCKAARVPDSTAWFNFESIEVRHRELLLNFAELRGKRVKR